MNFSHRIALAGRLIADFMWPPVCLLCHTPVGSDLGLCVACYGRLEFSPASVCSRCALPSPSGEIGGGGDGFCENCRSLTFPWRRGASPLIYNQTARELVLGFKYGHQWSYGAYLARLMKNAAGSILTGYPALVPVPLHPSRLRKRGFNQSVLLARGIARDAGLEVYPHALRREMATPPLEDKSERERMQLLKNAIQPEERNARRLLGRRAVLIDDVWTTGATIGACARALLDLGCREVDILTGARAVLRNRLT